MIICPDYPETYQRLVAEFERDKQSDTPKELKSYIERTNFPPIHAFMNLSMRNHQGAYTRIGHVSLSLQTPIQLDILAWLDEQPKTPQTMRTLRDQLVIDVVSVAQTRKMKKLPCNARYAGQPENEPFGLRSAS